MEEVVAFSSLGTACALTRSPGPGLRIERELRVWMTPVSTQTALSLSSIFPPLVVTSKQGRQEVGKKKKIRTQANSENDIGYFFRTLKGFQVVCLYEVHVRG